MDWITVVFIIIFFILPVIQQVLERSREGRDVSLPPDEDETDWEGIGPATAPERVRRGEEEAWRSGESTWSDGWAEWPGEEAERTEVTRPAPAPKREAKRKSLTIAVKPSPPPTERVDRGIGADITEPRSTARRRARRPAARAATPAGLATSLRDHRQLRRAIVLKEVLGPPLSLRTNEDRTDLG